MSLAGHAAVVTGGGRGIGRACALALADAGVRVCLSARTADELERVAEEIAAAGGEAFAHAVDVTDPRSVDSLAEAARHRLGAVSILVNNAGTATSAPVHRITRDAWDRVMAVNATGTFLCTKAFLPAMVEAGWGRIVNVASVAGLTGSPYIAAYAASKHAVIGFTRSVAAEVARKGVTVNAVCPGYVDTEMTQASVNRIVEKTGKSREEALAAILSTSPQRRLIGPGEVAHAVLSLCAEEAAGVNGQAIVIDGGGLLA